MLGQAVGFGRFRDVMPNLKEHICSHSVRSARKHDSGRASGRLPGMMRPPGHNTQILGITTLPDP
jgi:hypothetical protein